VIHDRAALYKTAGRCRASISRQCFPNRGVINVDALSDGLLSIAEAVSGRSDRVPGARSTGS
jgi:hypothetical protein